MKNPILKLVPKPSDLLWAMIKGLEKQSKRKDFKIDMGTFGLSESTEKRKICFGCAATCTIQQIAKKNFPVGIIDFTHERAGFLGVDQSILNHFESAVDLIRRGNSDPSSYNAIETLQELYGHAIPDPIQTLKELNTNNWRGRIKAYKAYVRQLKKCEL